MLKKDYHWKFVKQVINGWWRPLEEEDGFNTSELQKVELRLGIKLPEALWDWYLMVGRRSDLINTQDHILAPDELKIVEHNFLLFCVENQGIVLYGFPLSAINLADPPALVTTGNFTSDAEETHSFSLLILNMLVWATMMFRPSKYTVVSTPNEKAKDLVKQSFHYLGFERGLPVNETEFFCNEDAIVWLGTDWLEFSASNNISFNKTIELFKSANLEWRAYQG